MSKTLFGILAGAIICLAITLPVLADELKITVGVESGERKTEVVGADIYANVDGHLTEIMVRPDDQAFFLNGKFGALRLRSFWQTNAKTRKQTEPVEEVK